MWLRCALAILCFRNTLSYNVNRPLICIEQEPTDNCDYYDNPVFDTQNYHQKRMATETQPDVIIIDNRLKKDITPYYTPYQAPYPEIEAKYDTKLPVTFFPNMAAVSSSELRIFSNEEDEEEKPDFDSDKLWKVGDLPMPVIEDLSTLPDVYVRPDDVPSIPDMLAVEKSELTEETHHLEDVEFGEKYLHDPASETKEVIIEKVTHREEISSTENPTLLKFREWNISKSDYEKKMKKKVAIGEKPTETKVKQIDNAGHDDKNNTIVQKIESKTEEIYRADTPEISTTESLPLETTTSIENQEKGSQVLPSVTTPSIQNRQGDSALLGLLEAL